MSTEVDWDERQDQAWLQRVVTELAREDRDEVVRFYGPCPRCHDEITVEIPRPPEFDTLREDDGEEAPAKAPDDTARHACDCKGEHSGRPEGRRGCGVWGYAWSD